MKSLFTAIGVLFALATLVAAVYGCYLAIEFLWARYLGLDATVRLILLSVMGTVLLGCLAVASAMNRAATANQRNQMFASKVDLYKAVIHSFRQYIIAVHRMSRSEQEEALAQLEDLDAEIMILANSTVIDAYGRIQKLVGSSGEQELAASLQLLVKSMRSDIGHGTGYNESKLKFIFDPAQEQRSNDHDFSAAKEAPSN